MSQCQSGLSAISTRRVKYTLLRVVGPTLYRLRLDNTVYVS